MKIFSSVIVLTFMATLACTNKFSNLFAKSPVNDKPCLTRKPIKIAAVFDGTSKKTVTREVINGVKLAVQESPCNIKIQFYDSGSTGSGTDSSASWVKQHLNSYP